ncbi:hypothetical protein AAU61_02805 [Desulfocarbo indianensis]|nr:hypothetical protein AAU61_02805 [Desulfocarbo indianensis]
MGADSLTMSSAGDNLIITSGLDLQNSGFLLNGPGAFTVQGSDTFDCGSAGYLELKNGARLNLNGNQTIGLTTDSPLWGSGTGISLSNGATLTLTKPRTGWGNYEGNISGNGNLALDLSGRYGMTGSHSYTGWTWIISGDLELMGARRGVLPSSTTLQIESGAQLSPTRETVTGLSGAGTINICGMAKPSP